MKNVNKRRKSTLCFTLLTFPRIDSVVVWYSRESHYFNTPLSILDPEVIKKAILKAGSISSSSSNSFVSFCESLNVREAMLLIPKRKTTSREKESN
jgi:hypothetical protein